MIKNYLITALRNLAKQKSYLLINVSGLAAGLALFILAMLYSDFNFSFDSFHTHSDSIYSLVHIDKTGRHAMWAPAPMFRVIEEELPDINNFSRYMFGGEEVFRYGEMQFRETGVRFVDAPFLSMFTFKIIRGDAENPLDEPNEVVITESIAEKYFGEENPIGKSLLFNETLSLKVSAVTEKTPENSSISYNFLISAATLTPDTNWRNWCILFVQIPKGRDPVEYREPLTQIVQNHAPETPQKPVQIYLFPLERTFMRPEYIIANFSHTPATQFYIITGVAIALLIVVCINFTSLATARYINRAREVGMRKVAGAQRSQLIGQFLGESVLLAFIALPVAIALFLLIRPFFLTFMRLDIPLSLLDNPRLIGSLLGVTLLLGLAAGSYPAFFLSAFRPANVLRHNLTSGAKGGMVRKILVVSQFTLSIVLIIFAIVVNRQFNFLMEVDLGYTKTNLLCVRMPPETRDRVEIFKNSLLEFPEIISACRSSYIPVDWSSMGPGNKIIPEGADEESFVWAKMYPAHYDFIETLQMPKLEGREFSRDHADQHSVIISESLANKLPWDDPLGKRLTTNGEFGTVVGVVKDFHFKHVFYKKSPGLLYFSESAGYVLARTASPLTQGTGAQLEETWRSLFPNVPIDYFLLEDYFVDLFKDTVKGKEFVAFFSIIAIFFSCLGLLALASYTIERKTREIAIRKVLGASIGNITGKLLLSFLLLVGCSNLFALPLAYFVSHKFLDWAWVYKISIAAEIFIFATMLSIITAILAVLSQSLKAAFANPVDAIKYE